MTAAEQMSRPLAEVDPEVYDAIQREVQRQHSQAGDVVLVLVGNNDGVTGLGALADGREARARLPAAQTRIHQKARPLRRNPGGVPATSAG